MIVKRFGCTTIHNKALYKCLIHSFIPEQERFVKTITFLHKRVSKLQVTYMHYKTIEHNLKLIRQHTVYHEIKWHTRIKLFDIIFWEELHL